VDSLAEGCERQVIMVCPSTAIKIAACSAAWQAEGLVARTGFACAQRRGAGSAPCCCLTVSVGAGLVVGDDALHGP